MFLLQILKAFDWNRLFFGKDDKIFLFEVILRSTIMFFVTIIALRLIGKRGIMQGVFEIVTIITLGSAAGDTMFYKDVGLLPAIMVFVTIVLLYRIINFFVARSKPLEQLIEGRHVRLIKNKRFAVENFKPGELGKDEIFSDLRMKGVSHLGQVEAAYIEVSGEISVFFLPENKVDYGLPVRPDLADDIREKIIKAAVYACIYCGNSEKIEPVKKHKCKVCHKTEWVTALNEKRVI